MPARLKPSKKRRMLNMGTLTEKATLRPKASMDSTEMISIGWRPNLGAEVTVTADAWWGGGAAGAQGGRGGSYQSARIPKTRYPKLEPTSRANLAMWTSDAASHTRLHCGDKPVGTSLTKAFNVKYICTYIIQIVDQSVSIFNPMM